ncbi:MAG: FtsX-like permease family protein [Candidatus Hodarchaeales archaeon]|jgi:ABC-type antimicrobial peptide transport system permease subunit
MAEPLISLILTKLIGEFGSIISKNIVRKFEKVGQLSIILILILSFGLVIGNISVTYNNSLVKDAEYAIGSDIRILMPDNTLLDYNTSEFQTYIENNFSEIEITPLFIDDSFFIGDTNINLIGIDPETFFGVAFFQDYFIQNLLIKDLISQITYDPVKNNSKIVLSQSIADPNVELEAERLSGPKMKISQDKRPSQKDNPKDDSYAFYDVGDDVTVYSWNSTGDLELFNFTIIDIANHFPALEDIIDNDVTYAFTDYRALTEPINDSIILDNANATLFLGKTNNADVLPLVNNIIEDYNTNFPTVTSISIITTEGYLQSASLIGLILNNFVYLEIILVLLSSLIALIVFINSALISKREMLGTLNALGAGNRKLGHLILGELLITSLFTIIFSFLLGTIVSFTYLGFISEFFLLPISLTLSLEYHLIHYTLFILIMGIIAFLAILKIRKMDTFDLMREI